MKTNQSVGDIKKINILGNIILVRFYKGMHILYLFADCPFMQALYGQIIYLTLYTFTL